MKKNFLFSIIFIITLFVCPVSKAYFYDEESNICKINENWQYAERPMGTPLALALARIFVSEGGFNNRNDWLAIFEVLSNRSRSGELTLVNMMRYSPKSFNFFRQDEKRYIPYLNVNGERPMYWDIRYPNELWESKYQEGWFEAYALATRLTSGVRIPSSCQGRVDHWGRNNEQMIKQALSNGLTLVSCPGARNLFWKI